MRLHARVARACPSARAPPVAEMRAEALAELAHTHPEPASDLCARQACARWRTSTRQTMSNIRSDLLRRVACACWTGVAGRQRALVLTAQPRTDNAERQVAPGWLCRIDHKDAAGVGASASDSAGASRPLSCAPADVHDTVSSCRSAQGFKRYLDDVDKASRDCAAAVRRLVCVLVVVGMAHGAELPASYRFWFSSWRSS